MRTEPATPTEESAVVPMDHAECGSCCLKSASEICCDLTGVVCLGFFQISLVEKYIEEKLLDRIRGFDMVAFTVSLQ